ncbi:hypothetical protein BH11PSE7_BH11PSE7_17410 [soil metagenome]
MSHLDGLLRPLFIAAAVALALPAAQAQFSLAVSPPRFELATRAGTPVRDIIELSSDDPRAARYSVKTADWRLEPDGAVTFSDDLAQGSCRPWVAIERREVTVTTSRPYRFRFEVAPPVDAAPVECRFAIMLEGVAQVVGGMPLPVAARVGVIVYLAVGDVAPRLVLAGAAVEQVNGVPTPVLRIRNDGTAHARLDGFLTGTDAAGRSLEFTPSTLPVLPGETRTLALVATLAGNTTSTVTPQYPVTVKGKLEWGNGQGMPLEQRFAP